MRSAIRALVGGALFSFVFVGCSCEDPPSGPAAEPNPVFSPQTFDFGGLCAGSAARQQLTIENRGRGRLDVRLTFEGEAAASFRAERDGKEVSQLGVAPNRSEVVEIVYEPKGATGAQEAWLAIETNSKRTPKEELFLTGYLSENPAKPIVFASWELCRDEDLCVDDREACCVNTGGDGVVETVNVGEVALEQEGRVTITLESRGCAPVEITEAEVVLANIAGGCATSELWVDLPEGGLAIPPAVRVTEETLDVVFAPMGECILDGTVVLHTTDSERPTIELAIRGAGVGGSLTAMPDQLNFRSVRKGEFKEETLRLVNLGTDDVTLETLEVIGPDAEHFEIVRVEQCAVEIFDLPIEMEAGAGNVDNCAANLYLTVRYAPKGPGEHGYSGAGGTRIRIGEEGGRVNLVRLFGDSLPNMEVYPSSRIAFGSPAETGCGTSYACGDCTRLTCASDAECPMGGDGRPMRCLDAICVGTGIPNDEAICATSCGSARRTVLVCNEGFNDLQLRAIRIFDPDKGGYPDGPEGSPKDTFPGSSTEGEDIFRIDPGACAADGGLKTLEPEACCGFFVDLLDNNRNGLITAELVIETNEKGVPEPIALEKNTVVISAPRLPADFTVSDNPKVNQQVTVSAIATPEHGGVGRYVWEMTSTSGPSANPNVLPEGIIDPADPDNPIDPFTGTRNLCRKERCYELLNLAGEPCSPDGSDCVSLRFYPLVNGEYHFRLTVEADVCEPPASAARTGMVRVEE